jgi:two-component sensor histidine kinase
LGLGRAASDPNAQAMTITQVIRLLERPVPNGEAINAALTGFEPSHSRSIGLHPRHPLALIVNELLTNAIQHSQPIGEGRTVRMQLAAVRKSFQ